MNANKVVSMDVSRYILAGWLSILQAVILLLKGGVDLFGVGVDLFVENMSQPPSGDDIIQLYTGFHVVVDLMGIYVLLMFRRLLNERHNFHKADTLIYGLIFCYTAGALIFVAGLALIPQYSAMVAHYLIYFLSSLISIVYATRLLKLESNLSRLLKPYVYSTIASGVCSATLVLGQIGSLIFMVSLIFLGIILIRAESEPEYL